jgi:DNA-binding NtrC family response regulator
MARKSILVVDDEKSQREILEMILSGEGYDVTTASSGEAAMKFVADRRFDLVLTDFKMTGMSGLDLLKELVDFDKSIIVLLLTAHGTVDSAVDALRLGAFDYLQKPYDRDKLLETISRALNKLSNLDAEIISDSPEMDKVKKLILKVAKSNATVLIRGESGTGKELIARAIHTNSLRSSETFQAVNCAAINENLLESELFGHEKGSFTGAVGEKKGLFEIADRGTLFLDEIGELDISNSRFKVLILHFAFLSVPQCISTHEFQQDYTSISSSAASVSFLTPNFSRRYCKVLKVNPSNFADLVMLLSVRSIACKIRLRSTSSKFTPPCGNSKRLAFETGLDD